MTELKIDGTMKSVGETTIDATVSGADLDGTNDENRPDQEHGPHDHRPWERS